jgi:formate dehydrogenase iron-sulfur subunit
MYAVPIDTELCIGCNLCIEECEKIHGNIFPGECCTKVVKIPQNNGYIVLLPISCMHCIDPPCSKSCPSEAIIETPLGAIVVDYNKCIGCSYCSMQCPFGRIHYNATDKIPLKCDLCYNLIIKSEEPACVTVCPTKSKIFGTFEEIMRFAVRRVNEKGGGILYQGKTRIIYVLDNKQLEYLTKHGVNELNVLPEEYPSWLRTSSDILKNSRIISIPLLASLAFYIVYWRKKRFDEKCEE